MPEERRIEITVMATPESWQKFGNLVQARVLPPDVKEAKSKETLRTEVFAEAIDKLWKATFEKPTPKPSGKGKKNIEK